jgi:hypothetical protein
MQPVRPPPVWANPDLVLYHGTSHSAARNIVQAGVDLAYGKAYTDFGPGFYTTTLYNQAASWAWSLSQTLVPYDPPVVLELVLRRDDLARLDGLWFVRGDADADDLWSLIFHCRAGNRDHARLPGGYYDVVAGPIAAAWQQRRMVPNGDQISFHTGAAVALLNRGIRNAHLHPVI